MLRLQKKTYNLYQITHNNKKLFKTHQTKDYNNNNSEIVATYNTVICIQLLKCNDRSHKTINILHICNITGVP